MDKYTTGAGGISQVEADALNEVIQREAQVEAVKAEQIKEIEAKPVQTVAEQKQLAVSMERPAAEYFGEAIRRAGEGEKVIIGGREIGGARKITQIEAEIEQELNNKKRKTNKKKSKRDISEIETEMEQELNDDISSSSAEIFIGDTYLAMGNVEKAKETYQMVVDKYKPNKLGLFNFAERRLKDLRDGTPIVATDGVVYEIKDNKVNVRY